MQITEMLKRENVRLVDSVDSWQDAIKLAIAPLNEGGYVEDRYADEIIREALGTARLILMDLSRLYNSAGDVKTDMKKELSDLQAELDKFQLPKMPDLRWLDEAEKKMR